MKEHIVLQMENIHKSFPGVRALQGVDFSLCEGEIHALMGETADRYDIRFDIADYYGGLHCGECMDVFTGGKWKPTRIEYGDNWYLVGIRAEDLNGLRVRI